MMVMNFQEMNSVTLTKKFIVFFLMTAVFLLNVPAVGAQDVITAEDFTGGASVFTFRESRKAKKKKMAIKRNYLAKRNPKLRQKTRQNVRSQMALLAQRKPSRIRFKPFNPNALPKTVARTTAARNKASLDYAGAGETYLNNKEYELAVGAFKKSVEFDPGNVNARNGLSEAVTRKADALAGAGDDAGALVLYGEAAKLNPQNVEAYVGLGESHEALNNQPGAITAYEKALALSPDLTEIYASLGILYYQQGEVAKAEEFLKKSLAAHPQNAETQLYMGLVSLKQNRNEQALQYINQSIDTDPDFAEAYYYRGAVYSRQEKESEAAAEYQKALAINPNYTDALFDYGVTQYNQEKYAEAAEANQKVIAIDQTYGDAHANLAESYRQQGKYAEANARYAVATAYVKDDPELFSGWGYCLGREEKWDQAADKLKTTAEMRGDAVDYANVGWAYNHAAEKDLQANREANAAAHLELARENSQKATELNPNLPSAFLNLGTALNGLKDYENASNALQRAVALRDDWYFAHHELGKALRGLGKLAEAITVFQKVVRMNNSFAMGLFNLGEAQFASGDKKAAEKTMKELQKLNPNLANQLNGVLKGKIDEQKRKVEQKVKDKTINRIPGRPF